MSSYFEAESYVVGQADDVLELHRQIMRAEMGRPATSFSHESVLTGSVEIAARIYRSAQSRVHPQLKVLLRNDDSLTSSLDVCVYLGWGTEDEWRTLCYRRGELLEGSAAESALDRFKRCCVQYGLDFSRCGRLNHLLHQSLTPEELLGAVFEQCQVSLLPGLPESRCSGSPIEHNLAQGKNGRARIEAELNRRSELSRGAEVVLDDLTLSALNNRVSLG